jgi:ABC-type nitrate/sulfonate/bicarbonate transport system substrate-binding protein
MEDMRNEHVSRRRLLGLGVASTGAMCAAALLGTYRNASAQSASGKSANEPALPDIPRQVVRFGHLPFLDHTQAAIGIAKGFFAQVNIEIEPKPYGRVITTAAEIPGLLVANTVDVASLSAAFILQSLKQFRNLREFAIGDIFQGWAILMRADTGLQTYGDFVKKGASHGEAVRRTLAQLKGKRWTHPNVPGSILAVNVLLKLGGLGQKDVDLVPVAEPETVALMLRNQAEFQLGGAPSRLELQGKGFKPMLEAIDLAKNAQPSGASPELALVFYDGWITTTDFWEKHHDTVLRMASVQFRISKFIKEQQKDALDIHIPFLNRVSGRSISLEDGKTIYEVLDPFLTFEDQRPVLLDSKSPLYYRWPLEARIKILVESGVFQPGEVTADSATIAPQVYKELVDLKEKTDRAVPQAKTAISEARKAGKDASRAEELLKRAEALYGNYQFLDAHRFATGAKQWAEYR